MLLGERGAVDEHTHEAVGDRQLVLHVVDDERLQRAGRLLLGWLRSAVKERHE